MSLGQFAHALAVKVLGRIEHDAPWEPLLDELYAAFACTKVWKAFPETRATLAELAARGVSLAVISNWDKRLPEILDRLDLTGTFDVITVSTIEGMEKPAPEIFLRTVARLEVKPEAALHVGDSPLEDYQGARAAGLTPVLIDRHTLFAHDSYRRIVSLEGVLDLVG